MARGELSAVKMNQQFNRKISKNMKFKRLLAVFPPWLFTGVTLLCILWLTLAPKPLGEEPPGLFPGADKVAHAIMFGGFSCMMMLDWQRKNRWERATPLMAIVCGILSSMWGIAIEFAQDAMGLGRGFEYGDILADVAGAFFFALVYIFLQNLWSQTLNK